MRILVIALLAIALTACAGLGGEPEIIATVAPSVATLAPLASAWQPNLEKGAAIFADRCVDCHSPTGDGFGQLVVSGSVSRPLDMTDHALVAPKSPLEWYEIITDGRIDALMPPWENALTEAERWDVALYSYSLSYNDALLDAGAAIWRERCGGCEMPTLIAPVYSDLAYGEQLNRERFNGALSPDETGAVVAFLRTASLNVAPASDSEGRAALGSIAGRVAHGTEGGSAPQTDTVQLHYGSAESGFRLVETALEPDLTFSFDRIPISADLSYVVSIAYQGRLYSQLWRAGSADELTIEVFDITTDASVLSISHIELLVDAVKLADLGQGLVITQLLAFQNSSDRIFTSGRSFDDGREAVLLIQLPADARLMSGDEAGRYVIVEDLDNIPDSVIDTRPVPPGDAHQVLLEYFLPTDGAAAIEQSLNYRLDADVKLTLRDGLAVESDWLQLEPSGAAGAQFRVYAGRIQRNQNARLSLDISGDPFATSGDDRSVVTREDLPALAFGSSAIIAALLAAFGLARRRRRPAASEIDRLTTDLARLDADHDQGRINHDLYHHRRRELKTRLAELMADQP